MKVLFRDGTCGSETQVKGSGSEGEGMGLGQDAVGGVGREGKLNMMCWNVGGWGKKNGSDWSAVESESSSRGVRAEDVLQSLAK